MEGGMSLLSPPRLLQMRGNSVRESENSDARFKAKFKPKDKEICHQRIEEELKIPLTTSRRKLEASLTIPEVGNEKSLGKLRN